MTKAPARTFDLSNLFGFEKLPEPSLDVSHLMPKAQDAGAPPIDLPNLDGKRKALFVVGAGNTGKTVFLRWACRHPRTPWALLTIDTINRELVHYYSNVATPPSGVPTQEWLGRGLDAFLQDPTHSAAVDTGGGDTSLVGLAHELPGLPAIMEAAGLHPVLLVILSPRVADLKPLMALDDAGFQPKATALVLNLGLRDGVDTFHLITSHSVFKAAKDRGAVVLTMPRLFNAGPAIEQRHISFDAAASDTGPLPIRARASTFRWLQQMDEAFAPIRSWLP